MLNALLSLSIKDTLKYNPYLLGIPDVKCSRINTDDWSHSAESPKRASALGEGDSVIQKDNSAENKYER